MRWRTHFARVLAFLLTHCCDSVTLAQIERAIIEEVVSRAHHAREGQPSPAQRLRMPGALTRWRIKRAARKLHRTVDGFRDA